MKTWEDDAYHYCIIIFKNIFKMIPWTSCIIRRGINFTDTCQRKSAVRKNYPNLRGSRSRILSWFTRSRKNKFGEGKFDRRIWSMIKENGVSWRRYGAVKAHDHNLEAREQRGSWSRFLGSSNQCPSRESIGGHEDSSDKPVDRRKREDGAFSTLRNGKSAT